MARGRRSAPSAVRETGMHRLSIALVSLLGLAACAGEPGEPGSGAAYMSPPFGEYATPAGPTDLAPDARTARGLDPLRSRPGLPRRR
jgi:hypothetical protein